MALERELIHPPEGARLKKLLVVFGGIGFLIALSGWFALQFVITGVFPDRRFAELIPLVFLAAPILAFISLRYCRFAGPSLELSPSALIIHEYRPRLEIPWSALIEIRKLEGAVSSKTLAIKYETVKGLRKHQHDYTDFTDEPEQLIARILDYRDRALAESETR